MSVSLIWRDTVSTGLSEVIGSWKIMEISFPRMPRIAVSESFSRSVPSKRIDPETMRPGGSGIRRNIESEVTLLPQPDSPTTPRVSPRRTPSETPSTARTMPSRVKKYVRRSSISRSGVPAPGTGSGVRASAETTLTIAP